MELIDIGRRIRKVRKSKGVTLKELSKSTFSVGKLSNIENGIGTIDKEDISVICSALGIPLYDVMEDEESEGLILDIQRAGAAISYGSITVAEKILKDIKKKIPRNSEIEAKYYFTLGEYYKLKNEQDNATEAFMKVIALEFSIRLRVRAYNALACIKFEQGAITSAVDSSMKALELSESNLRSSYEKFLTFLNLSIFYLHLRKLDYAMSYAHRASDIGETDIPKKATYLTAIVDLIQGMDDNAEQKINQTIDYFQREKDLSSLKRAWLSRIYLYKNHPFKLKKILYETKENLIGLKTSTEGQRDKIFLLKMTHSFSHISIKEKYYEYALSFLQFAQELRNPETTYLDYKTYYLLGVLYREWTHDKQMELRYLRQSVELFPMNINLLEKATILHELFLLEGEKEKQLFFESSSLFYQFYNQQNKNIEILNDVILMPSYYPIICLQKIKNLAAYEV